MKRGGDLKRTGPPERRTELRRSRLPRRGRQRPTEISRHEVELRAIFHATAMRQGCCQNCGYVGVFVEAHHAIARTLLKKLLLKKGAPCPPEVIWDPRNAMLLCAEPAPNRCHGRHTLAFRRTKRRALRPEHWAFARELGLEWVLETEYPA